jgi:hypothetical protein
MLYQQKKGATICRNSLSVMYRGRESNPYERFGSQDFKSCYLWFHVV